jgi:hypothetical protein
MRRCMAPDVQGPMKSVMMKVKVSRQLVHVVRSHDCNAASGLAEPPTIRLRFPHH